MKAKYTKEDLIDEIVRLRLEECRSTKTILDMLSKTLGYSKTQSYEYLKWAREKISEQYSLMNPAKLEEAIGQYEEAIEIQRLKKDWKMWSELNRELNKLKGLINNKVDITSNGKDISVSEIVVKIVRKDEEDIS